MGRLKTASYSSTKQKEHQRSYEARSIGTIYPNRVIPYFDGERVGFDYYLEPTFFVRFLDVVEIEHSRNELPILSIMGLDPARATQEHFEEMVDNVVNRQRIVEGFQSAKNSICFTTEQQEAFGEVVTRERFMAKKIQLFVWKQTRDLAVEVQPPDLDDRAYELFLDLAQDCRIGYFLDYKNDIDIVKAARFDFEVKLGELEMDPNFVRRQMKIKLFKRQYNMQVPIPIEHVRKKFGVATAVLIVSLVVGAVGHSIMMAAPGVLGKVAGATLKAAGAMGALLGRKGYKTLIEDFEDRPVILQTADDML